MNNALSTIASGIAHLGLIAIEGDFDNIVIRLGDGFEAFSVEDLEDGTFNLYGNFRNESGEVTPDYNEVELGSDLTIEEVITTIGETLATTKMVAS